MVMTENDEKLITSFFEEYRRQVLPDNGFSDRVMLNLPKNRHARMWCLGRLWTATCVVAGILLFFMNDGFYQIKKMIFDLFIDIMSICVSIEFSFAMLSTMVLSFLLISIVAIYNLFTYSDYEKTLI